MVASIWARMSAPDKPDHILCTKPGLWPNPHPELVGELVRAGSRFGQVRLCFGIAIAGLRFGSLAAPLLTSVSRLRGSLLVSGGAFAAAGLAPMVAAAVAPLAIAGAAGTAVECASTDVLQRSVPDRFRAFSLGLTDSIMVAAAMLGSLLLPQLSRGIGAPAAFVLSGVGVVGTAAFRRLRGRPPSPASVVVEEGVGQ